MRVGTQIGNKEYKAGDCAPGGWSGHCVRGVGKLRRTGPGELGLAARAFEVWVTAWANAQRFGRRYKDQSRGP